MADDNQEKKVKKIIKLKVKSSSPAAETKKEAAPAKAAAPETRPAAPAAPRPATTERTGGYNRDNNRSSSQGGRSSYNSGGGRSGGGYQGGGSRPGQGGGSRPGQGGRPGGPSSRPGQGGGRPGPGGRPGTSTSTSETQKDTATRNKHRSTHAKPQVDYSQQSKKRQEDIIMHKLENNLNRNKKGEVAIPEKIEIGEIIKIADLAKKMNLKASVLIQKFMEMGTIVTINDTIDADSAIIVCEEFKCEVTVHSLKDEVVIADEADKPEDLKPRPPIVTVMGHVDHGKTKLLDTIRKTNVIQHESGGITQHIGAYKVKTAKGLITFLDTPGHEAFTAMRARGAQVTDIVVLVVSAVEGVLPQTVEAINHAKSAGVPIIVAINKMDLPEARPDRVMQMVSEQGLVPEEWGGETQIMPISALKGDGINELLDAILLRAEVMDLKANPAKNANGFVIESKMDIGKGALATVVVQNGSIKVGDYFVVGASMGKVRAMFNDKGDPVNQALPSDPVEIMGFSEPPQAGEKFHILSSDAEAREIANKRTTLKKMEESTIIKKVHMEKAMDQLSNPNKMEFKLVVKADVNGSVEAIKHSLSKLNNEEVGVNIIHYGIGAIKESDVMLATATATMENNSKVLIVGFRVRVDSIAKEKAESEGIEIKRYNVIYDLINYIHDQLEGMLSPDITETIIGTAEIQEVFKITGVGKIAGCIVKDGFIRRAEKVRLYREGVQVWDGDISALKRFKDDVKEVQAGFECGISLQNYENMKKGDIIECYSAEEKKRKLVLEETNKKKTRKAADAAPPEESEAQEE